MAQSRVRGLSAGCEEHSERCIGYQDQLSTAETARDVAEKQLANLRLTVDDLLKSLKDIVDSFTSRAQNPVCRALRTLKPCEQRSSRAHPSTHPEIRQEASTQIMANRPPRMEMLTASAFSSQNARKQRSRTRCLGNDIVLPPKYLGLSHRRQQGCGNSLHHNLRQD
jgi:hypothetical protein